MEHPEFFSSRKKFSSKENPSQMIYKIVINLDDHNRLISPLLTKTSTRQISTGTKIFRASLNVLLPRYGRSIDILNPHEFLTFCERKAQICNLGVKLLYFNSKISNFYKKTIAFSETLELLPPLIAKTKKTGPAFFQIGYVFTNQNNKNMLNILPFNTLLSLRPSYYKAKITLLHENEGNVVSFGIENPNEETSHLLNVTHT